uniref:Uncharacterized protein n=2 Tax=unclassified Caudoviricetes TaxID=2788787 RepID=A0A8S5LTN7_9CAUD|nr:MAG TPA: hypothetical protein [Siphoviridae sp. ctKm44]DAE09885.1 MAG TPA: hypothetical protein [Siphoviridae sp. ctJdE31]
MEIKFHTKPTQINRKNPIVIKQDYLLKVYMYPLKGDFYVRFAVVGSTAFAGLVKTDDPTNISAIMPERTIHDIYTKMDLTHYIIGYLNIPLRDIESIYNG